jgi:hypothetical protein
MAYLGLLGLVASRLAASTVLELTVLRHPRAFPIQSAESARIIQGAQKIIAEACKSDWGGKCRFNITQRVFRNAEFKDRWVGIAPGTQFTKDDIDAIEGQSDTKGVFVYLVRGVHGCRMHSGEKIAGCTIGNCIFLPLLKYHKVRARNGNLVDGRDDAWFDRQSYVLAHEIGHIAGLPDLCADRFKRRLMFGVEDVQNRLLLAKECVIFENYPRVSLDFDSDPDCDKVVSGDSR